MNFRRVEIHRLGRLMKATDFLAEPCFHEVKDNTWGESCPKEDMPVREEDF